MLIIPVSDIFIKIESIILFFSLSQSSLCSCLGACTRMGDSLFPKLILYGELMGGGGKETMRLIRTEE